VSQSQAAALASSASSLHETAIVAAAKYEQFPVTLHPVEVNGLDPQTTDQEAAASPEF